MSTKTKITTVLKWIKTNIIIIAFFFAAVAIELIATMVNEGGFGIVQPATELALLLFFVCILFLIPSNKYRFVVGGALLLAESVIDLAMILIYDMTGQYFSIEMLNLRNDAFGILESIPVNFVYFLSMIYIISTFFIICVRLERKQKRVDITNISKVVFAVLGVIFLTSSLIIAGNKGRANRYDQMINGGESSVYGKYGMIGNLEIELLQKFISEDGSSISDSEIESYIYETVQNPTSYFGVSKENNVVMILAESLEWFAFMNDESYPNRLKLTDEQLKNLYPNLTKMYEESVSMTNFHSREKTDIAETLSILGSYPPQGYVAYDYPENEMLHAVPNILKMFDEDIQNKSFHNGTTSFYNRKEVHKNLGFESFLASEGMIELSEKLVENGTNSEETMHNYIPDGQRNLDSEMIETCKDEMFPKDKRFYTYITTITMHGMHYERETLTDYRRQILEVLDQVEITEEEDILINYMSSAMELDKAIGIMMDDLEEKEILDNTTIIIFGDHNIYYQGLSNYVKDIRGYDTEEYYTNLYRVPLMIYDKNIEAQQIDKFASTSDMVPTLLDILGINTFANMYYGNSVFSDEKSVLYSRAYDTFIGDGVIYRSLNEEIYKDESVTKEYENEYYGEAIKLVDKIRYCDSIFKKDYFLNTENKQKFTENMQNIQVEQ